MFIYQLIISMSFFGKNIRKIRTAKKISQSAFAELFKLKRGSIGAYEEGRAEAKIDTIIEIADYFKLSVDQLLCKELTFNEIYHIGEISKKYDEFVNQRINPISVPLIQITERKEFLDNMNNQLFLNKRLKICLPELTSQSIAFEISESDLGNMDSKHDNNKIVICLPVNINSANFLKDKSFIIITHENFMVANFSIEKNKFNVIPSQRKNQGIEVEINEIMAVFEIYRVVSENVNNNSNLEFYLSSIELKINRLIEKLL
ncbi:MAG: helix-turn-helix transcriptional regulator [Bacteroidales bacterium]